MSKPKSPTTLLSAAVTIMQWRVAHDGQWPRYRDSNRTPRDGLYYPTTYYKLFGVGHWSAVLEITQQLCSAGFSGCVISALHRMKRCANQPDCQAWIVDEGCHVRYCEGCKQRWRSEGEGDETYAIGYLGQELDLHAFYEYEPGSPNLRGQRRTRSWRWDDDDPLVF